MNAAAEVVAAVLPKGWRKFTLSLMASVASMALCYLKLLSGAEFVAMQSLVLGLYGAANVTDKKLGGAG